MTALSDIIRREITQTGPITVARYMDLCLGHPQHGYYKTRDPLGAPGDFTTAPEISQMFGEMIGAWAAAVWIAIGRPVFRLVELGPGRGTLMADLVRVLRAADATFEAWLVETSPALRARQKARLDGVFWADSLAEVPSGPTIIVANEFFDALPVHQFICSAQGWRERMIGMEDENLRWGLSAPLPERDRSPVGAWRESSPASESVLAGISDRLGRDPGGALIVDYGYTAKDRPEGPTLQAVRDHAKADPLEAPGEADLTWLIDFDWLARRLGRHVKVTEQGAFLASMGIGQRAEALARARPDQADGIADALERLTAPDQMGRLFKVATMVTGALSIQTPRKTR